MHSFLDAKVMARTLRQTLADRSITLTHSECLELVAQQFGLANWNVLSARIAAALPEAQPLALPDGWRGANREKYRLGLDPLQPGTARIESRFGRDSGIVLRDDSYGHLMQSVIAGRYRGGRVRLTASLRTEDADLGSLWLRVDRAPGQLLRFDNLMDRDQDGAIRGTTGWTERSIVLDVPADAASLYYGFFLKGFGRSFARDFRLETVGDDVVPTSQVIEPTFSTARHLPAPANLDFRSAAQADT